MTDHQTSEEEIESLSPLLSSLKNKNPYSVPAGYFETLETKLSTTGGLLWKRKKQK